MAEENNRVLQVNIEEEMEKSYIDYAMSVIVSRALPDVRDGLKPVHRRILYAMSELGLTPEKSYRKCARIVGDVLGKYHPHGDSAVYEALVRLAQDFSTRYPLVDGHGNFGSVDGDGAAAMRYTEAKMTKITQELLRDINKNTVNFSPNFDETLKEPEVLPSRFPNLLVNGSAGIAVGMATNIPPHNLGEIIDGIVEIIDHPEITIEQLMKKIKGPDFPTGGIILGKEGVKQAYTTGRGKVKVRAKANIEQMTNSKYRIIVTEIPYQVNKAKLIEKIAELVKDKKIEGISDLRDESDRHGMRIVVELKKDVNPNVVLNLLYKHTQMQETFGVIMLALVNNEPRILNLRQILDYYIEHQKEVIIRRTRFDLEKAQARAHILEGLRIALDHIDAVIDLIRNSKTVQIAKDGLIHQFKLSEKQAQAILDMRLQRLTGLEREKIEEEYHSLLETIKNLKEILESEYRILQVIREELLEVKEKYNDDRRTGFDIDASEIDIEDLIEQEDVIITLTHFGYIKRLPSNTYRSQKRGGKGVAALSTREDDFVEHLFMTSTHHYLLFFTNKGKVYRLKAFEIPEASRQARGTAIVNILQLDPGESIATVIPVKEFKENHYLIMTTKLGIIKKTELIEYDTSRRTGLVAISLKENDELINVRLTNGDGEVIIGTKKGYAIRFSEKDVRPTGRTSMGVKGIDLRDGDEVIGMDLALEDSYLLAVSENGFGKMTPVEEYRIQSRGGKGIITYNITSKTGDLVGIRVVQKEDEIMLMNNNGIVIRLEVKGISKMGRNTQGVTLMRAKEGEKIITAAKVYVSDESEEDE
ncbi:DNA gyrase subunit A [Garciella nitratireducens]|uniref:DNA gyrase subunit A n=1 Tax=Garciella nitratireducens TaxID=218205 RepID=UPI001BD3C267|nr:DNA gyrase subunit A [Garciella nitratireducens]